MCLTMATHSQLPLSEILIFMFRFSCLLIPINVTSHIEVVKNAYNFKEITICLETEVPIPATAMYCRNWRTWNDHQTGHVNINFSVTDSNWRTYNNHLLLIVNTDSIANKPDVPMMTTTHYNTINSIVLFLHHIIIGSVQKIKKINWSKLTLVDRRCWKLALISN